MLRTTAGSILLWVLAACGPAVGTDDSGSDTLCDPWTEVCEVSLHPSWGLRSELELDRARITDKTTDGPAEALGDGHVRASVSRYLALQSELDEQGICLLRPPFERLDDVPFDDSVCTCEPQAGCWDHTALFGLVGADGEDFEHAGLLLKSSSGALYRARVLRADSDGDHSTLTIEYEGVM